jgi:hypothetical protein
MNNEPVAWIYDWGDEQDIKTKLFPNSKAKITPLYTHPAKTLTDAEFDNIFANGKRLGVLETEDRFCKAKTLTDEEIITVLTNKFVKDQGRYASTNLFYIEFARAILKKAQEADKIESLGTVNIGGVHFRNGKEVK